MLYFRPPCILEPVCLSIAMVTCVSGYKQNQMNIFNDDLNPGLALLADWVISSGNTGLSVDMLTVYLEKLDREDVVEIIQKAQGRVEL